jgi:flagellar biogenesis protein FliO
MSKLFSLVLVLGLILAVGYVVRQLLPDIQRYLRMQSM